MFKLLPLLTIFISMNCWAPHYTTWWGVIFEDWKIAPELATGGSFADHYSFHNDQLAVLEHYTYSRNDLINEAIAGSGVARKDPSQVNIYQFDGADWNLKSSLFEPDILESTPYVSPEEPSVIISSETGFGESLLIRNDILFIGMPSLGSVKLYAKESHPTIASEGTWVYQNDILPLAVSLPTEGFGRRIAFSENVLIIQNNQGALFVHKKSDVALKWELDQEIYVADPCFSKDFELSGNILIIGSIDGCTGKVWIYESNGDKFNLTEIHSSPDPSPHPADTEFGHSVSINGNNILITHSRYMLDMHGFSGAAGIAYIGNKEPGSPLTMTSVLNPNDPGTGEFGWDADISNNKAIVNDPYFSSFVDGSVTESGLGMNYLYVKTAESTWDYLAKLSRSDAAAISWFGRSGVEITDSGFALVADPYSDSGVHPASAFGGIYIYDLRDMEGLYFDSIYDEDIPAMGVISSLMLALSILGMGWSRIRKNEPH